MSQNENKPISAEPVSGVLRRSDTRLSAGDAQMHAPDTESAPVDGTGKAGSEDTGNSADAIKHRPGKR